MEKVVKLGCARLLARTSAFCLRSLQGPQLVKYAARKN
jgi:hypothetical protein